jgi:hypothetical protein
VTAPAPRPRSTGSILLGTLGVLLTLLLLAPVLLVGGVWLAVTMSHGRFLPPPPLRASAAAAPASAGELCGWDATVGCNGGMHG